MRSNKYSSRCTALEYTSDVGPALACARRGLVLAWVERETGRLRISFGQGLSFGASVAIEARSENAPGLWVDGLDAVVLAWTDGRDGRIHVVQSSGRSEFEVLHVLDHRSAYAPAICRFGEQLYLAWTGDDAHVRVMTHQRVEWSEPRSIRGVEASGPPALAPVNGVLHLVWRDTDRRLSRTATTDGENFEEPMTVEAAPISAPSVQGHRDRLAAVWQEDDALVFDPALDRRMRRAGLDVTDRELRATWPYPALGRPAITALEDELVLAWTAADSSHAITIKRIEAPGAELLSEFTFHGDAVSYNPFGP